MKRLYQDEIEKLEDNDLQLQYILGGFNSKDKTACPYDAYWGCDIRCSCTPVEQDERFLKVKEFIIKHNISNSTFLRLILTYLTGSFVSYNGNLGNLIEELDRAILEYDFKLSNVGRIKENNLKEKELLELIINYGYVDGSSLNTFLNKYSLTLNDFLTLAKTRINYNYRVGSGFEVTDLPLELNNILEDNNIMQSYEFVKNYRKNLEINEKQKSKFLVKKL